MEFMMEGRLDLPELVLGSAMWGWTVSKATAFSLLDAFYEAGLRRIDAATNYPINKNPADFRRSEQILLEWIKAHGIQDLSVLMKVGSLSNRGLPDHNLEPAFLLYNWRYYRGWLGDNLAGLMIHWDNRAEEKAIAGSLDVLKQIEEHGLEVGFSGVQHPGIYARLNERLQCAFLIQFKHNLSYSDYPRYAPLHASGRFYAYGINGGGIKLDPKSYHRFSSLKVRGGDPERSMTISQDLHRRLVRFNDQFPDQAIHTMNEAAMAFALQMPELAGVLLGPSRLSQLAASLAFYRKVQQGIYANLFPILLKIHRKYAPEDRQV